MIMRSKQHPLTHSSHVDLVIIFVILNKHIKCQSFLLLYLTPLRFGAAD